MLFGIVPDLYRFMNIPFPIVWLTDGDAQIATGFHAAIPDASHALRVWHIEQKVATNCKKHFPTNEAWYEFFGSNKDEMVGEF